MHIDSLPLTPGDTPWLHFCSKDRKHKDNTRPSTIRSMTKYTFESLGYNSFLHCEVKQASPPPSALLLSEFSPKQESGNTRAPAAELHPSHGSVWRERHGRVLPGQTILHSSELAFCPCGARWTSSRTVSLRKTVWPRKRNECVCDGTTAPRGWTCGCTVRTK